MNSLHASRFTLHVSELFSSIQGESYLAGLPCIFVRLTGCHLRCKYCDSQHAYTGGRQMSVSGVVRQVSRVGLVRQVCLTGGEPLLQDGVYPLMRELLKRKYLVSLETSGTLDISRVPKDVVKVMDIKTPGSRMSRSPSPHPSPLEGEGAQRAGEGEIVNPIDNLKHLIAHDEVKFVVTDKRDIDWSLGVIKKYRINRICHVSLSPVLVGGASRAGYIRGKMPLLPNMIAQAILKSGLDNVRLQVQLHKIVGLR